MEGFLIDQYMELINKDQKKLHSIEDVTRDSLMEHSQSPCKKDCDHEDQEKDVEFPLCEKDDYPSLCTISKDTNHWKKRYVKALFEKTQVIGLSNFGI